MHVKRIHWFICKCNKNGKTSSRVRIFYRHCVQLNGIKTEATDVFLILPSCVFLVTLLLLSERVIFSLQPQIAIMYNRLIQQPITETLVFRMAPSDASEAQIVTDAVWLEYLLIFSVTSEDRSSKVLLDRQLAGLPSEQEWCMRPKTGCLFPRFCSCSPHCHPHPAVGSLNVVTQGFIPSGSLPTKKVVAKENS